jgi:hypothetical protein
MGPNIYCFGTCRGVRVRKYRGLRMPREEIAFTPRPELHSHSQIFWYGQSIFCLPHWPNFSDIFDSRLHWGSVVREKYVANFANFQYWNMNRVKKSKNVHMYVIYEWSLVLAQRVSIIISFSIFWTLPAGTLKKLHCAAKGLTHTLLQRTLYSKETLCFWRA